MSALIKVGETISIPKSLSGAEVIFNSPTLTYTTTATFDESNLHLLNEGGDTVLVLGFRRATNMVVLNTRHAGAGWDYEGRVTGLKDIFGPLAQACIVVKDTGNAWDIVINGKELTTFDKRITGDVVKVFYEVKGAQDSMFSDPMSLFIV